MKNILKILMFLIYLVFLFSLNNIFSIVVLLILNIIVMVVFYKKIQITLNNIIWTIIFAILTILINSAISGIIYGLVIGTRLLIAYMSTYIFMNMMSIKEIVNAIEIMMYPFRIFKIDTKQISLIILIALNILPNMKHEIKQKMYAISSKGFGKNSIKGIFLAKSMLISILVKTNEMEQALIAKGYENEN